MRISDNACYSQPQEPRIEVIPKIMLQDVDGAVFGVWKSGPPPPLVLTDQMVSPRIVLMNAAEQTMKGFCNFSGGTRT